MRGSHGQEKALGAYHTTEGFEEVIKVWAVGIAATPPAIAMISHQVVVL